MKLAAHKLRYPGFTLLEVIIAMALVGVIAAALFSSLHVAFKAQQAAQRAVQPLQSAGVAMDMLRDDILSAQPPHGVLVAAFVGASNADGNGNDGLDFYCTSDGPRHQSGNGEIKHVQLLVYVPDGSSVPVLVRRVWGNLLSATQVDPDEEVICRNVSLFTLRYYDGLQWQESWDSTQYKDQLPGAVEVTLEINPPQGDSSSPIHLRRIFALSCIGTAIESTGSGPSSSGNKSTGTTGGTK